MTKSSLEDDVVYSDVASEALRRKRRLDLRIGYGASIAIISAYSVLWLTSLVLVSENSPQTAFFVGAAGTVTLPIVAWLLWYTYIKYPKMSLEHGIVLTRKSLRLFDHEIPLVSVLRVEVVRFTSSPGRPFLAIDYRKQEKVTTRLLYHNHADDIHELCDMIRDLKGWPRQEGVPWRTWSDWKRTRKALS